MANQIAEESQWLAVIGRSLAFLCLAQAELRHKDLAPQARFLQGLGLSIDDAAEMLGTTTGSLRVLLSRSKKRGKKRGPKKR
jgi:DNA-directed RNA polymerase specialized sigma24 family protein